MKARITILLACCLLTCHVRTFAVNVDVEFVDASSASGDIYVSRNVDDDDKNEQWDKDQNEGQMLTEQPAEPEDDLKKFKVTTSIEDGTLSISVDSSHTSNVRFWADEHKKKLHDKSWTVTAGKIIEAPPANPNAPPDTPDALSGAPANQEGTEGYFWVEGLVNSASLKDIEIKAEIGGQEDPLKISVIEVDLDVDSKNEHAFDTSGFDTDAVDMIEKSNETTDPGKIVIFSSSANSDADQGDQVPDFADGFNLDLKGASGPSGLASVGSSLKFVPVRIELKTPLDPATAKVKFPYQETINGVVRNLYKVSRPELAPDGDITLSGNGVGIPFVFKVEAGGMRLWNKNATERTSGKTVADNGNFIPADEEIEWSKIAESSGSRTGWVYLEYVDKETPEYAGKREIKVTAKQTVTGGGTLETSDTVNVCLIPVEFKKMWETPNKANQIVVKARRDDPATSSQQPDAQDNLYGAPRNVLYVTANPADGKYHVSINIAAGMRDQFVGAAYKSGSKVSGTDKAFSATEDQPVDMLIPATGNSQSGEDFVIKVAYDLNKNGLIDTSETAIELEALKSDEGASLAPMVRGFSAAAVTAADSTIQGQAFGTGWTGWKPNWVGGFFVPNAIALEKLFYTGNAGQLDASYAPTVTLPNATLNALGSVGDFNEWLTHHTGVQFDSEGIASIKHYQWAAGTRISNLIAASTPLSTLKSNGNIVTQMQSETTSTVNAYKQAGIAAGQSQVFPNANGHDLQAILTSLGKPHWSPSWVPKQTLLIGDEDGYAGAIPDDAFGTVGRSRFLSGKYWFVAKKENRIDYEYIPDAPAQEHPYTAVVVYLRISGTSQDLYDFNHNAGGLSVPAAITQLSYGNGSYGRGHGIIYRTSVNILNDYEMQEIRLP